MEDPSRVASTIRKLIEESSEKKILGTRLGVYLQKEHPGFSPLDHGRRNLLDFVRAFAPQVYVVDRAGGDVVYALTAETPNNADQYIGAKTEPEVGHREMVVPTPIWKTFVSPSGPYKLFVHPDKLIFEVLGPNEPPLQAPWKRVPPCPAATHIDIAKEFLATLPDAPKVELEQTLSSRTWWVDFLYAARRFGLDKQWILFRRRRLLSEFCKALAALGIEPTRLPASVEQRTGIKPEGSRSRTRGDLTRRVALGVVSRISTEELRDIWLPLGLVIDEIQNG